MAKRSASKADPGGSNPSAPVFLNFVSKVGDIWKYRKKERRNCLRRGKDSNVGAMFCQQAKPCLPADRREAAARPRDLHKHCCLLFC